MTTYPDDDQYDDEQDEQGGDIPSLRRAARKASKLEKENAELKRQVAFASAGLPLSDPKMGYFVKGYDGDLAPEAIRQAAIDAGFLGSDVKPSPQDTQAAQAEQRVIAAAAGAEPFDRSREAAVQALEDAMKQGGVQAMLQQAAALGVSIHDGY